MKVFYTPSAEYEVIEEPKILKGFDGVRLSGRVRAMTREGRAVGVMVAGPIKFEEFGVLVPARPVFATYPKGYLPEFRIGARKVRGKPFGEVAVVAYEGPMPALDFPVLTCRTAETPAKIGDPIPDPEYDDEEDDEVDPPAEAIAA